MLGMKPPLYPFRQACKCYRVLFEVGIYRTYYESKPHVLRQDGGIPGNIMFYGAPNKHKGTMKAMYWKMKMVMGKLKPAEIISYADEVNESQ